MVEHPCPRRLHGAWWKCSSNLFRAAGEATAGLSPREKEIIALLAKGYLYKEIASQLGISVETVRTHIHNTYEKLHVRNPHRSRDEDLWAQGLRVTEGSVPQNRTFSSLHAFAATAEGVRW